MAGIGSTLTEDIGPMPMWAWAGLGTAGLTGLLISRKKKAMNAAAAAAANTGTQSNLGTVPISNLTTQAEPMPIQMGDTFVNVPPSNVTVTNNEPVPTPGGGNGTLPPGGLGLLPPSSPPPTPQPQPLIPAPPVAETGPLTEVKPQPGSPAWKPTGSPAPTAKTYVVVAGDNLSSIAKKFGTTWQAIYNANKAIIGANPNLIRPGQHLVIP